MLGFRIADFVVEIETDREDAMYRRMENYYPFALPVGPPQGTARDAAVVSGGADAGKAERPLMRLSLDGEIVLPPAPVQVFEYDLTEDKAALYIYPDRHIFSITLAGNGMTFLMECPFERNGTGPVYSFRCDITRKGVAPPRHVLDHFMVQAFSIAGGGEGMLLIHASTITYKGRTVMFLGESGTGKSTHSRMWLGNIPGAVLLNDDAPAVRVSGGGVTVYGTPWSGKVPCYKAEQYPLAACVRIRRALFNKMNRLDALQAFGALLPSCLPTLQQRDETLDPVCASLSGIVRSTPVFILDCLPDAGAAMAARAAIFGE